MTKQNAGAKVVHLYGEAKTRIDSWLNTVTGLGTRARDKVMSAFFSRSVRLADQELEDLYNGDDLAAKIVGKLVDDALRQGYEIAIKVDEDASDTVAAANDQAEEVEAFLEDEIRAGARLREGWTWGRLFGGAAIYVVTDEGFDVPQDEELDLARLRKVLALTVLDKRDLTPFSVYSDPADPRFGEVETYLVNANGSATLGTSSAQIQNVRIHETRLIVFEGALTTNREKQSNSGWSLSVLQRPYDQLRAFNTSFQAVSNLLQDASQGVFSMDGLIDMIASGEKEAVQTRMALVDLQRSVARSLVIDAEKEKFERLTPPLTGYPETLEILMLRLSAAADIPVSVLFGRAPAGLNATGESDRLLWAQSVESEQTQVAIPALARLAELVFASAEGPTGGTVPDSWEITFPPLVHMTEKEEAEIRKLVAEADAIYTREGVLLPEEVAINRFRATGFSSTTQIDTAERELMLEEEKGRLRNPPPPPPQLPPPPPNAGEPPVPPDGEPPVPPEPGSPEEGAEDGEGAEDEEE